jgi:hypothetical protein
MIKTLTKSARRFVIAAAALLVLTSAPLRVHAEFTLTLQQAGPDVLLTGSGTINLSALTFAGPGSGQALLRPNNASVYGGPTGSFAVSEYVGGGFSGPASFGSGSSTLASSGTGSDLGVLGAYDYLVVPAGYVSNTLVTETATFAGQSFATLGFTQGTYTYTWGTGATADSLVVTSVIPEPSTWALVGFGVGVLGVMLRQRRRRIGGVE